MRKNRSGTILITSLWLMAILSILAIGIGFRISIEMRLSRYNIDRLKALYLAKAGVVKAEERLSNDNNAYDSIYECGISLNIGTTPEETPQSIFGADSNSLGNDAFSVYYKTKPESGADEKEAGGDVTYYGMVDEERKININMDNIPLSDKPGEYRRILKGLSSKLDDDIIDAVIDWQDEDHNITGARGAEDDYYQKLEPPYECKDADFTVIEELLFVKDMKVDIFNEIKDYITAHSNGKININTASQKVLDAIIIDEEGKYTSISTKIIEHRNGADNIDGTKGDLPITSLAAITNLEILDNEERERLASLAGYFDVKSEYFRIVSHGTIGKTTKIINCVIKKNASSEENPIKYYREE